MQPKSLGSEEWREYDFAGRIYKINDPVELYHTPGATTHRIVDANGLVHCVPAPGVAGCVLRWKPKPGTKPVDF